jgi:long-subunit acyl-CoA synthetase (AMP-forming)
LAKGETATWDSAILAGKVLAPARGVVVPTDDLADLWQPDAVLGSSSGRLVFTTARHLEKQGQIRRAARVVLVNEGKRDGPSAARWLSLPSETKEDLPTPTPDYRALLSWTSRTAGSPKAFSLTHCNIATNVDA